LKVQNFYSEMNRYQGLKCLSSIWRILLNNFWEIAPLYPLASSFRFINHREDMPLHYWYN